MACEQPGVEGTAWGNRSLTANSAYHNALRRLGIGRWGMVSLKAPIGCVWGKKARFDPQIAQNHNKLWRAWGRIIFAGAELPA